MTDTTDIDLDRRLAVADRLDDAGDLEAACALRSLDASRRARDAALVEHCDATYPGQDKWDQARQFLKAAAPFIRRWPYRGGLTYRCPYQAGTADARIWRILRLHPVDKLPKGIDGIYKILTRTNP